MMEHPIMPEGLGAQAARVLDPGAPAPLKMMAASGVAPLPPEDLVKILYFFAFGPDQALAAKARESLPKLPDATLLFALERDLGAAVIDGAARVLAGREDAVERIVLNQAARGETIAWLTERIKSERLLEMVAANEERLLRCPLIIEAMYMNRAARMSTVDRLIELAVRNGIELSGIPSFAEVKAAIAGRPAAEAKPEHVDQAFQAVLGADDASAIEGERVDDILGMMEAGVQEGASEEERTKVVTIEASISTLTVSQKIRVAMLGNASQRAVLIRDANRLVSMAVLKSPGISESEVIRYSKARSLPEEAVRYIANKKDWVKAYQVKLNLVNNPRTPLHDALRFLPHLRPNDVRALERSRDVPQAIVNAAKQLRQKRGR